MKNLIWRSIAVSFVVSTLTAVSFGQVASGGPYTIEQSVIAGGGGASTAGPYTMEGTVGQPAAGTGMTASGYFMRGGFWTPAPFGPTAATVTVSGRVTYGQSIGIKNINVILAGGKLTAPKIAITNQLGQYLFEDVEAGQSYVLSISSKRFTFAEPVKFFNVFEALTDVNFQGEWGDN